MFEYGNWVSIPGRAGSRLRGMPSLVNNKARNTLQPEAIGTRSHPRYLYISVPHSVSTLCMYLHMLYVLYVLNYIGSS